MKEIAAERNQPSRCLVGNTTSNLPFTAGIWRITHEAKTGEKANEQPNEQLKRVLLHEAQRVLLEDYENEKRGRETGKQTRPSNQPKRKPSLLQEAQRVLLEDNK